MTLSNRICILILTLLIERNRIYQLQKCIQCYVVFFFSSIFTQTNTDYSLTEMQFHLIFDSITIARAKAVRLLREGKSKRRKKNYSIESESVNAT